MELKMFVLGQQIDAVPLNPEQIKVHGYVQNLRRQLEMKHRSALVYLTDGPQFIIEGVPSTLKMESREKELHQL
jgi:hypothetical protein